MQRGCKDKSVGGPVFQKFSPGERSYVCKLKIQGINWLTLDKSVMGIQRNRSDLFTAEGIEQFNGWDNFNCFINNSLILIRVN